jgi:hypothetical protein
MKRSPIHRHRPLRALRWGLRRRRPRRLDRPGADLARLRFCYVGPCAARATIAGHRCRGRLEACHEGRAGIRIRGMALKVPDDQTFAMCSAAHREWTRHTGVFRGWSRANRKEWADEQAARTHARFLSHGARRTG